MAIIPALGGLPQPTKSRVRSFYLNSPGAANLSRLDPLGNPIVDPWNLSGFVNRLAVYETIDKPYLTAQITLVDNNNLLDNMRLKGGEDCYFSFDGGDGYVYEQTLQVISVHGNKSKVSAKAMQYDIHLIGEEYYKDKASIVQMPFKNTPGTAAASQIHGRYIGGGLNVLMASLGMLSKESYTVKSHKPFKAIDEIKARLSFPGHNGNCLYFKNKFGHQLGPLGGFLANATGGQRFVQKTTWGRDFIKDTYEAQAAILFAAAFTEAKKPGSAGNQEKPESKGQGQTTFDQQLKKIIKKSNPGGGGKANFHMHDGAFVDAAVAPWAKLIGENMEKAFVRDNAMVTVKVPIQTGLNVTAGGGCYLDLLPPIGDLQDQIGPSVMTGNYMIAKLCHELFLDDRKMNATTTFEAYRVA